MISHYKSFHINFCFGYILQNISLVNFQISLNIEGIKYNVSCFFYKYFVRLL
jgi:hypothetical protein